MSVSLPPLHLSPFQRWLGPELVHAERGRVEIRLPFREEFLRAEGSDWYHGGVIAALADLTGDYALWTEVGAGLPTIDLRVDWLRPARKGTLAALGRSVRVGKTVCVADVEIRDEQGELVALGRGTYANTRG
jgi:uncharacterized protein (TIGR00369 family)